MSETAVGYLRLSQDGKSLDRQRRDVEEYAEARGFDLEDVYNEGKRASGFDEDRPEYQALLDRLDTGTVDAVVVPNLSRLSRDRKERLRLLLDLDDKNVQLHSAERGHVDLSDPYALTVETAKAETDDIEKRKEIERSKRATEERMENGYDQGRPPYGLTFDEDGRYWVPDREGDEFLNALECIKLRQEGRSWREIADETDVSKDTARRIYDRRQRYLQEAETA